MNDLKSDLKMAFKLPHDSPYTIGTLLAQGLETASGQEIVYGDRVRHGYGEFAERVGRLAASLARIGVKPGSTVAMMDWDSHRYLEAFFAVPMMGAVLHTVNVRLSPEQLLYTVNHARDDVIVVNVDFLPMIEAIHARIRPGVRFVLIDEAGRAPKASVQFSGEYEAMLRAEMAGFEFPLVEEEARATTFYTTGTTGLPKGVYFSHRQLVLHTLAVSETLAAVPHATLGPGDVYMPITPMFHVHAWGIPYVATLLGVKQVYPGRYVPEALLALIAREGVTFSHCVPTILQMMLTRPEAALTDLSRWKVVIGGSALPLALARNASQRGVDIVAGYGMSETCPILTLAHLRPHMLGLDAEERLAYLCRAGRAIPFVDIRIVDAEMRDLPADGASQGEIVVRAPWLTRGYLDDAKGSADLWRGGWLHTGDVGTVCREGYLRITDRIKDVVKTGGEWVSSLDIEDIILRMPGVAEAAVVGLPDEKWGERPVALVVAKAAVLAEDEVRRHVAGFAERGVISKFAVPQRVHFVDAIPKTSVGKLDKKAIRAKLLAPTAVA